MVVREVNIKVSASGIQETQKALAEVKSSLRTLKSTQFDALKQSLEGIPVAARKATDSFIRLNEALSKVATNAREATKALVDFQKTQGTINIDDIEKLNKMAQPGRRRAPKPPQPKPEVTGLNIEEVKAPTVKPVSSPQKRILSGAVEQAITGTIRTPVESIRLPETPSSPEARRSAIERNIRPFDISSMYTLQKLSIASPRVSDSYKKLLVNLQEGGVPDKAGFEQARVALEQMFDTGYGGLIAKVKKEIVGAISYDIENGPIGKILTVHSLGAKYTGKGIGTELIKKLESLARQQKVDIIKISNALPDAHDFYIKHGYKFTDSSSYGMYADDMFKVIGDKLVDGLSYARLHGSVDPQLLGALYRNRQEYSPNVHITKSIMEGLKKIALKTKETKTEHAFWLDRYGRMLNIPYKSTDENLEVDTGGDSLRKILSSVESWHTHPSHVIPVPSAEDIDKLNIHSKIGILATGSGRAMRISLPKGVDQTLFNQFVSMWEVVSTRIMQKYLAETPHGTTDDAQLLKILYDKFIQLSDVVGLNIEEYNTTFTERMRDVISDVQKINGAGNVGSFMQYRKPTLDKEDIKKRIEEKITAILKSNPGSRLDAIADQLKQSGLKITRKDLSTEIARLKEDLDAMPDNITDQIQEGMDTMVTSPSQGMFTSKIENLDIKELFRTLETDEPIYMPPPAHIRLVSPAIPKRSDVEILKFQEILEGFLGPEYHSKLSSQFIKELGTNVGQFTIVVRADLGEPEEILAHVKDAWEKTLGYTGIPAYAGEEHQWVSKTRVYEKTPLPLTEQWLEQLDEAIKKAKKDIFPRIEDRVKAILLEDSILAIDKDGKISETSGKIGKIIDSMTSRAGALGRVSWLFTSIAMGALGVYFSIMSINNAIMRGVQTVMGPLMNLDSIIQGYALNQAFLSGTALDLNDYMKKLGLGGMQDVINASLKLQALFGTLTAAFGMFAAKLVSDPEVFGALKKIVGDIMEFFTREDVYETFKGLIVELSKHMPEILNTFKWLADVVRTVLVPNIGIIVKVWTVSMLVMPAASLVSALLNVGKVALSVGKMIQLAFSAKTFSEFTAGLMGMRGAMTGIGATLGTAFGIAFAAAAGAAIGLFVVNILDKFGILRELHKLGYSIGHGGSLEGYGWKKESMLEESGLGFLKFMAAGGTLKAGEPAVVGEQGPELIIPKGDVEVVPNKKLRFLAAGTSIGNAMGSAGIDDNTRALKDNTEALKKSAESKKDVTAYLDSLVMAGNPIYSDFTITSGGGPKSARDVERAGPWIFQQGNRIERVQGESVLRGQISKSYPEVEIPKVEIPKVEDKEKKPTRTIFDDIGKVMSWLQPKLSIMGPATLMGQPGMGIATQLAMGAFGQYAPNIAKTLLGNNKIAHAPDVKAEASNKTAFDKLVEGNLVTNKVLNEMKSQQHEDAQDISKNVVGVKNIIQFKKFGSETVMNVTGNAGGTGIGTAGNIPARGGIGTGKTGTTGTEAKHLPWVEETKGGNAGWSEGLTGNPLVDFSKTGKGWSTKYTPGGMYGPGGSAGAPSVSYGGINPYTRPANDNGKAMQTDSGAWYYTDYTGRTFGPYNVDGEQEAISAAAKEGAQTTAPPAPSKNAKPKNMYDQLSKLGITIEQSSDTDKQTNDVAVMKRYAAAGGPNVWGSIVEFAKAYGFEWYGTIPESDVYSYMISGNPKAKPGRPWKPVPSMAAGGIITGAGLINAHAGEVIGPLGQVAGLITQAVTNTNVTTNTSSPNVNITINISGNATKEVTDDMVRKLKRELFGRGVL